jgi:hypothetical protein
MAITDVTTTIKHIKLILNFIGMTYKEPTQIFIDNTGAIFLANNWSTSSRTKHIDTRYHFIREYIEDGSIELIYIRTNENPADMFTKNLSTDKFDYHNLCIMDGMPNYLEEQ